MSDFNKNLLSDLERRKEGILTHIENLRCSMVNSQKKYHDNLERILISDIQIQSCRSGDVVVTEHAINRFRERIATKRQKRLKRSIEIILTTVKSGVEIYPLNNVNRLIKNEFREARYLMLGNVIAVVEGRVVKTIYKNDEHCKRNFK